MNKLRIVVGGYIGLYPTGGATWDYIQYPLGLRILRPLFFAVMAWIYHQTNEHRLHLSV